MLYISISDLLLWKAEMESASSNSNTISNPTANPSFICPQKIELIVITDISPVKDSFIVNDANGRLLFRVKDYPVALHGLRVLLDQNGNPIITLRKKIMTMHNQWQVLKGESKELLYTVKSNSMFKPKTKLDIFLANKSDETCDYKLRGNWSDKKCEVYAEKTASSLVANICRKENARKDVDELIITVYPNNDYAFVLSLVLILDKIDRDRSAAQQGSASADPVGIL